MVKLLTAGTVALNTTLISLADAAFSGALLCQYFGFSC